MPSQAPLRPQVMDTGGGQVSIPASGETTLDVLGTVWPLLPNQRMRLWQFGAQFIPVETGLSLKAQSVQLTMLLLDSQGNIIPVTGGELQFTLAAKDFTDPAFPQNSSGFAIAAAGRPLLELQSGFLVSNVTGIPMPSFAELQASCDVVNTDAVNAHTLFGFLTALLSWE